MKVKMRVAYPTKDSVKSSESIRLIRRRTKFGKFYCVQFGRGASDWRKTSTERTFPTTPKGKTDAINYMTRYINTDTTKDN